MAQALAAQLAEPLALLLCTLISVGLARLLEAARKRVSSQFLNGVLGRVDAAVADAVGELEHTIVAEFKEASADGKLTPEEVDRIKAMAISRVRSSVGKSGIAALRGELGGDAAIERLIVGKVENEVRTLRESTFGRTLRTPND